MKIFEQLLLGSDENNRMLAAIRRFTSDILAMADPDVHLRQNQKSEIVFAEYGYAWRIHSLLHVGKGKQERRLAVELLRKTGDGYVEVVIFSTYPPTHREPALADVLWVYESLETLTQWLLDNNPPFKKKTQPLFATAHLVVSRKE